MHIFGTLAAILHLGNLKITGTEQVTFENKEGMLNDTAYRADKVIVLEFVSKLLGVDTMSLQRALVSRRMSTKVR